MGSSWAGAMEGARRGLYAGPLGIGEAYVGAEGAGLAKPGEGAFGRGTRPGAGTGARLPNSGGAGRGAGTGAELG